MGLGFISYSVSNDAAFDAKVKQAYALVGDLSIPFQQIFTDFQRSRKAIFQLSGPGKYPTFKGKILRNGRTAYENAKIKKYGFSFPLLKATGKLEASITSENEDTIKIITPKSLVIGTRVQNDKGVQYPVFHQSDEPRNKMPLRKFLFIGPEAPQFVDDVRGNLDRYQKILDQYIKRKLGATFQGSQS